jgi:hypothetical protein
MTSSTVSLSNNASMTYQTTVWLLIVLPRTSILSSLSGEHIQVIGRHLLAISTADWQE